MKLRLFAPRPDDLLADGCDAALRKPLACLVNIATGAMRAVDFSQFVAGCLTRYHWGALMLPSLRQSWSKLEVFEGFLLPSQPVCCGSWYAKSGAFEVDGVADPERLSPPAGLDSFELTISLDPASEAGRQEPFCFSTLGPRGFSRALTKLSIMLLDDDPQPDPDRPEWHSLEPAATPFPRLVGFYAVVAGIAGTV